LIIGSATCLIGCGTAADSAWTTGVAPIDARAIGEIVAIAHPACKIQSYSLKDTDTIYCNTSCGTYLAHRTRKGWKVDPDELIFVTQATIRSNQTMKLTATATRFGDTFPVASFLCSQISLCPSGRSLSFSR
jgi:hypothetical protein